MNLDWLLHPLTYCVLLAAGLCCCLYLFLTVKAQMRSLQKEKDQEAQLLENALQTVGSAVEGVQLTLRQREEEGLARLPHPGMNLDKRTQVVRMHGRGEPVSTIAASVGVPQNEVELLLKVQQLVLGHSRS